MEVLLANTITSIGSYAFSHSDGLTLMLPDSVTYIADYAFYHGDGMTITLPETVTYIDANAFSGCTNLRLICQNDYAANYAEAHMGNVLSAGQAVPVLSHLGSGRDA